MNIQQAACNYAMLRFLPYPETGEFVNVGVLVSCQQPCLFEFQVEGEMSARMKGLFPHQDETVYRAAAKAMQREMERVKAMIRDPRSCQLAFLEAARPRESVLRFGEVRTILSAHPGELPQELFNRYVRMEKPAPQEPHPAGA